MTPTEWIAARRSMLAKKTPGLWLSTRNQGRAVIGYTGCGWAGIHGGLDSIEDARLIVAAVNEQEAVVRLVEAAIRLRKETAPYVPVLVSPLPAETARRDFDAALAALVGEEEK